MHKSVNNPLDHSKKDDKESKNEQQQPKKNKEKLSRRDIHELMGTNKKLLHRGRGGAFR